MTLPYQCLAACSFSAADSQSREWTLLGATGSKLVVQSSTGATSIWPPEGQEREQRDEDDEPPGKRVKLSPPAEKTSNFCILKLSKDKRHIVAVTAEDKCIRVFQIDAEGRLQQLSQRCMAKRPCSVTLTADDSTILCADKFGDVYALPLLPDPEAEQNGVPESETDHKKFVPSASLLTVHSGRNRKTLEDQLKQAEKGPSQSKEAPKFKHDLLLGHVSMLTDITYTTAGPRSYILTADRDEHIRVSRGPPQAHIIEGFCQGHEEFVSRLCLLKSGRLVSGGGDPHLYIWDWLSYRLLQKIPIRDAVQDHYRSRPQLTQRLPQEGELKIAVSGIWSVPGDNAERAQVLVACEGVPALFSLVVGASSHSGQVLALAGNALDVAFIEHREGAHVAVVSVDHVRTPGSTTEKRADEGSCRLQYFVSRAEGQWSEDAGLAPVLAWFSERAAGGAGGQGDRLGVVLYGVESLRKRPGAED